MGFHLLIGKSKKDLMKNKWEHLLCNLSIKQVEF